MGERFFETEDKRNYETPENNVKMAALKLLRHKMLVRIGEGYKSLYTEDINEILVVAGLPLITPDELKAPEVDVIKVEKEAENDNAE